jgi:hypothetical protein
MLGFGMGRGCRKGKGGGHGKAAEIRHRLTQHAEASLLKSLFFAPNPIPVVAAFQTFSLAIGGEGTITTLLLDRFLACMKPASKT